MKRFAPAAERNKEVIADALSAFLPPTGTVLEVASGSGQHIVHLAARYPNLTFQPSDRENDCLDSIEAYTADSGVANVLPPVQLDVERDAWPSADAVVCINMVHIAPWSATLGLLRGSAACLPNGGRLILYGPYRFDGVFTAPSNEQFDRSLREQNSTWGVRDLSRIGQRAEAVGFDAEPDIVPLPANNHLAIFRKSGASS